MKKQIIILLMILTGILSGCLLISINPYYTRDTITKFEGVEGSWIDKDSITWTFSLDTANFL